MLRVEIDHLAPYPSSIVFVLYSTDLVAFLNLLVHKSLDKTLWIFVIVCMPAFSFSAFWEISKENPFRILKQSMRGYESQIC